MLKKTSLTWLNLFVFGMGSAMAEPSAAETNRPPNIVVIVADDLGYSDISYNPYHGPEVSTPHIDALIRSGVWFSDAYVSGNICAPSRAGFLSGCYQQRLGVHHEGDVNSTNFPSAFPYFPQHLKQADGIADYETAMIGKWHQNRDQEAMVTVDGNTNNVFTDYVEDYGEADPGTLEYHPSKRGFDRVYGFIDLGGSSYWDYGRGFYDQYYRHEYETPIDGIHDGDAIETYMTTRFTEEATEFIDVQVSSNKPFFVYLSYNAVHTPMHAPASPVGLSQGDDGWYPDAAWFNTNYPNMWATPAYSHTMGQQVDQETRAILMAMLYHMDEGIGQVMDCLETNGVRDNTIVVFWSDNGGSQASRASNNPLRERKHFNYEGGVRIPMCISWPNGLGAYSNTTVSTPVMSIDILPTVLEAVGMEPIGGAALDGKSLLPVIRGETNVAQEALFWSEGLSAGEYAVRHGDWKLYMDEDINELYDLSTDIGETNDLAALYPQKARALRQMIYTWMVEMTATAGEPLEERMWIFETPAPTLGPDKMVIEEFDYSAGPLAGKGGGSGWFDAWNGNGDMSVATPSLRFENSFYNNGAATGRSSDDEISNSLYIWKRTFAQPLADEVVWLSFLSCWDPDFTGQPSDNNNTWQALLLNGDPGDALVLFGGNGDRYPGAYDDAALADLKRVSTLPKLADTRFIFTDTQATYLHIVKLETNVSNLNDRATWYATSNPNGLIGNTVADLETAVSAGTMKKVVATSSDGDWWGDSLRSLGLYVNNTDSSDLCDISFDNIRVAYGLDDHAALQALLSGDTGSLGSLPVGYALKSYRFDQGQLVFEHDEKTGWYPGTAVYESTDSLTNEWLPVSPVAIEQVDRYLDFDTYRVRFPAEDPQRFYRIRGE